MSEFPYRIVFKYGPIKIELDGDKEFVEKAVSTDKRVVRKDS